MDSIEVVGVVLFAFCLMVPVMSIINNRGGKNEKIDGES